MLASACDTLITHPNVVNGADINELPTNGLYIEGSILTGFLMGTVGLQCVRSNRILMLIEGHHDDMFVNAAVNTVNAARTNYGLDCPIVVELHEAPRMESTYTESGRAGGRVEKLQELFAILDRNSGSYDAVAISSVIVVSDTFRRSYYASDGRVINPWGGVEAILTHALSSIYNVPTAHSPMMPNQEIMNWDPGIVDPRMGAEVVSTSYFQCTLKGLMRSPRIITDRAAMGHHSVLTAADVSCLVIPDWCIGLPTLAALKQGIPVIAVKENRNIMRNDLTALNWADGQLWIVENYWEAVGVLSALRAGVCPRSVRRPIAQTALVSARDAGQKRADAAVRTAPTV